MILSAFVQFALSHSLALPLSLSLFLVLHTRRTCACTLSVSVREKVSKEERKTKQDVWEVKWGQQQQWQL